MLKVFTNFCLVILLGTTAFGNEDTDISPAGKAKALQNRPYFGCVLFEDIMNSQSRATGKGTLSADTELEFNINGNATHKVQVELTGWGAFGAAFNLRIENPSEKIFQGTGIGYVEFTQYRDKSGKLALGDFSKAKENSVDGILNHFFCTPMKSLSDIQ